MFSPYLLWPWIIEGQGEQTKKYNMKWKCMTVALGEYCRTAGWGPFECVSARVHVWGDMKKGTISLRAKMRLGNWIEHLHSAQWKWFSHRYRRTYGVWGKAIRWWQGERNAWEAEEITKKKKKKQKNKPQKTNKPESKLKGNRLQRLLRIPRVWHQRKLYRRNFLCPSLLWEWVQNHSDSVKRWRTAQHVLTPWHTIYSTVSTSPHSITVNALIHISFAQLQAHTCTVHTHPYTPTHPCTCTYARTR